jgi:hypothetical protein
MPAIKLEKRMIGNNTIEKDNSIPSTPKLKQQSLMNFLNSQPSSSSSSSPASQKSTSSKRQFIMLDDDLDDDDDIFDLPPSDDITLHNNVFYSADRNAINSRIKQEPISTSFEAPAQHSKVKLEPVQSSNVQRLETQSQRKDTFNHSSTTNSIENSFFVKSEIDPLGFPSTNEFDESSLFSLSQAPPPQFSLSQHSVANIFPSLNLLQPEDLFSLPTADMSLRTSPLDSRYATSSTLSSSTTCAPHYSSDPPSLSSPFQSSTASKSVPDSVPNSAINLKREPTNYFGNSHSNLTLVSHNSPLQQHSRPVHNTSQVLPAPSSISSSYTNNMPSSNPPPLHSSSPPNAYDEIVRNYQQRQHFHQQNASSSSFSNSSSFSSSFVPFSSGTSVSTPPSFPPSSKSSSLTVQSANFVAPIPAFRRLNEIRAARNMPTNLVPNRFAAAALPPFTSDPITQKFSNSLGPASSSSDFIDMFSSAPSISSPSFPSRFTSETNHNLSILQSARSSSNSTESLSSETQFNNPSIPNNPTKFRRKGYWFSDTNGKKTYVDHSGARLQGGAAYVAWKKSGGGFKSTRTRGSKRKQKSTRRRNDHQENEDSNDESAVPPTTRKRKTRTTKSKFGRSKRTKRTGRHATSVDSNYSNVRNQDNDDNEEEWVPD